ncbi:MAG: hypothetical protein ACERKZ_16655 [Lachnotalea sp.]
MAITCEYPYYEMYGRTRSFKADRCINNESMRAFYKNKINVKEIVSFDSGLLELQELREYNNEDVSEQILLRDNYPYENHAYCEVVEVWRKLI